MKINDVVKQCHEIAREKGWWQEKRKPLEIHALIHSEISEATEAVRKGIPSFSHTVSVDAATMLALKDSKPEGEAVELVDAVIRIFDYFGKRGWDFEEVLQAKMDYNKTRPHRHGGKLA